LVSKEKEMVKNTFENIEKISNIASILYWNLS
jgi:hypothetical protein